MIWSPKDWKKQREKERNMNKKCTNNNNNSKKYSKAPKNLSKHSTLTMLSIIIHQ